MKKHVAELKFAFTEETFQQRKDEISVMRENGYILHTEAIREFQNKHKRYPNKIFDMHKSFEFSGENP